MAGLAQQAHISSRIIVENYADMALSLIILFEAFDGGNLAGQCDVHHIAALAGQEPHPASSPHLNAGNLQMIDRRFFLPEAAIPTRSLRVLLEWAQPPQNS